MKLNLEAIYNYSASEIADSIRSGEVKAIDVVKAFRERATDSNKLYNNVVQFFDEYSQTRAEWYDNQISQGIEFPKEEYPLLGVPISIKDCFGLKGHENTVGLEMYKGLINERTHPLINLLEKAGAIPFCSTTLCQFMGSLGSTNSHGTTLNPYSKAFTCGGSSSGEGSLIGSNGSILGVGNDFGGYCGIYGLKTTPGRNIEYMERVTGEGFESILPATGPMARHVKDIDLTLRAILNNEPWRIDHSVVPLPYREVTLPKKLRIGYYLDDGKFPASPACKRAVMMTVEALKASGHEVFPYEEPTLWKSAPLYLKFIGLDKSLPKFKALQKNEKFTTEQYLITLAHRMPKWIIWLLSSLLKYVLNEKEFGDVLWSLVSSDIHSQFQYNNERQKLEEEHFEAWNNTMDESGNPMDFVICPVTPLPSFKHETFLDHSFSVGATFLYNMLGNAAGVIPVTRVNKETDKIGNLEAWLKENISPYYKDGLLRQRQVYSQYSAEEMEGLPVSIQVIGRRFEEEKVAKGMELIDEILKGYDQPNKYTTYEEYYSTQK
ncbi:amidase signature enzyme [Conidiobolus coronatus NRRL 28638]|uniref:Amidase signature enzyme n=1 Tax=Conidiobolus coronatus (strain ATCC 28846 / CBS 209.66 / NRRL 28638) TaxID=796925 RepID=A0A137NTU4_CONC2|nr:amidase signature enzyme [Conidiobolus coronatus NRRL 28638]|eukprot:KXN66141.1 amidase signature enzyme [Conidiobolus coronatus NRRL 28638]